MAKKKMSTIIGDLFVDLTPEAMEVKTGKGKKQQVDAEATFQNIAMNISYYRGLLDGLDAIAGSVPGLDEALTEYREVYDVLFVYASENLEGFDECAENYGLESFGTQDVEDDDNAFTYLDELDRTDLTAIAKYFGIRVMRKDADETLREKILAEVEEEELNAALAELGYYDDEDDSEEVSYADMSLGELRKECKARGIKYSPKDKADDLIAKLEEDDETGDEEELEDDEDDSEEVDEHELDEILDEEFEDEVLVEEENVNKGNKKLPKKK